MGQITNIKKQNSSVFIDDIKKVTECLIWASETSDYIKVAKKEVLKSAETNKIIYELSTKIYKVGRLVMIIY